MTQRPPRTFAARPKSLQDGTWGANIETDETVTAFDYVRITSKGGKTWDARIAEVFRPWKFGVAVRTERLAPGEVAPDVEEPAASEAAPIDLEDIPF